MVNRIIATICCWMVASCTLGQVVAKNIGDNVSSTLQHISMHDINGNVRSNDLKGKKVIVHFWATWCAACIRDMPMLDSLQAANLADLRIILVTYEMPEDVELLKKRNSSFAKTKLLLVSSDTFLTSLFPYRSLPHNVWIDSSGKVSAITSSAAFTQTNLRLYLQNQSIILDVKKDIMDRDFKKPVLLGGLGQDYHFDRTNLLASSLLTGYIDGLVSVNTGIQQNDDALKFLCTNHSISDLFRETFLRPSNRSFRALAEIIYFKLPARTILEVSDSTLLWWPGRLRSDWNAIADKKKVFTFEVLLTGNDTARMQSSLRQELNRFGEILWGITATIEKRKAYCWALQETHEVVIQRSRGGTAEIEKIAESTLRVNNIALDYFLFYLIGHDQYRSTVPIINETTSDWPVDLLVEGDLSSAPSLNASLAKYGLEFRWVERELDMLVISDVDRKRESKTRSSSNSTAY